MCYISSIFLYFHWDFDNRHYFYDKGTFNGFFKSSSSARLCLKVLVKMPRLNLKTACIDSLLCYISFCFLYSSDFFLLWLSYLSHAISPYLHGKLINWTRVFLLANKSVCYTVLLRIMNKLIFISRVISIICICQLYLMLFHM